MSWGSQRDHCIVRSYYNIYSGKKKPFLKPGPTRGDWTSLNPTQTVDHHVYDLQPFWGDLFPQGKLWNETYQDPVSIHTASRASAARTDQREHVSLALPRGYGPVGATDGRSRTANLSTGSVTFFLEKKLLSDSLPGRTFAMSITQSSPEGIFGIANILSEAISCLSMLKQRRAPPS